MKAILMFNEKYANCKFTRVTDEEFSKTLANYEIKQYPKNFKFGVLYAKEDQIEDDMFDNSTTSTEFEEFLQFLGDKIELKHWTSFTGGLDVEKNSTGLYSYYTKFKNYEIMYHVSTLLPHSSIEKQQLERKRHLGNDIVTIIFYEGTTPFNPAMLTSQFNHVRVIITPLKNDEETFYKISIAHKQGVRPSSPFLPTPAIFPKSDYFRQFLLTKLINCERAALFAPEFAEKLQRTRTLLLRDIISSTEKSVKGSYFIKKTSKSELKGTEKISTHRTSPKKLSDSNESNTTLSDKDMLNVPI